MRIRVTFLLIGTSIMLIRVVYGVGSTTLTETIEDGTSRWSEILYEVHRRCGERLHQAPSASTYYMYSSHQAAFLKHRRGE